MWNFNTTIKRNIIQCEKHCEEYYREIEQEVCDWQYGVGGLRIPRGYYCPSLIRDIVIGNCHRGKLLKRVTKRSKPSYRYGFDKEGRLRTVEYLDETYGDTKEFIIYNGSREIGITFTVHDGMPSIDSISESYYEGNRIQEYAYYEYMISTRSVVNYIKEFYKYEKNKLIVEVNARFSLGRERYIFNIENGFLKNYTIENYIMHIRKPDYWDGTVWDVNIERQIPQAMVLEE